MTEPYAPLPPSPRCVRHPDALAVRLCERCGDNLCIACVAPSGGVCVACAAKQPELTYRPFAWEDPSLSLPRRVLFTLGQVLRPVRSAPSYARGTVGDALRFALVTSLPPASLSYVVMLTHTLLFGPSMRIALIGTPSLLDVALDVLRAMALGVLFACIHVLASALTLTLCSGFRGGRVWLRHALYWSWWASTFALLTSLVPWLASPDTTADALSRGSMVMLILLGAPVAIVSLVATYAVSRRARQSGVLMALLAVLASVVARYGADLLVALVAGPFTPPPPA